MEDFGESADSDASWISIADLMAALMIVFLFIAVVYIRPIATEQQRVREIAVAWRAAENEIYDDLTDEFEKDLARWDAEIERTTLVVRFRSPDVLFDHGQDSLKPHFKRILDDFFPRYVNVLERHLEDIEEVRVEGHTSSGWRLAPRHEAYMLNMELSQARTRAVIGYVIRPGTEAGSAPWLQARLTANGLSSSRTVHGKNGAEDADASRRVEFRIRTRTRTEIKRILETVS